MTKVFAFICLFITITACHQYGASRFPIIEVTDVYIIRQVSDSTLLLIPKGEGPLQIFNFKNDTLHGEL